MNIGKRTQEGQPIFLKGELVLTADVLALFTGVNYRSVEKVLAGLEAIHKVSGVHYDALIDMTAVPLARVQPGDSGTANKARLAATSKACRLLVSKLRDSDYGETLLLSDRFPAPVKIAGRDVPG